HWIGTRVREAPLDRCGQLRRFSELILLATGARMVLLKFGHLANLHRNRTSAGDRAGDGPSVSRRGSQNVRTRTDTCTDVVARLARALRSVGGTVLRYVNSVAEASLFDMARFGMTVRVIAVSTGDAPPADGWAYHPTLSPPHNCEPHE